MHVRRSLNYTRMSNYRIARNKLYCDCKNWSVSLDEKGIFSCDCGKYTYKHTYRPHDCGCRGKFIHTKSVTYGETTDYIT